MHRDQRIICESPLSVQAEDQLLLSGPKSLPCYLVLGLFNLTTEKLS